MDYSTEIMWTDHPGSLNGEVHVYACDIDTLDMQASLSLLTKEELAKATAFRQKADADRFITGRLVAKKLLSHYGITDVAGIIIAPGANGKPAARAASAVPLPFFNISHSGNKVLVAVSNELVGVDVELVTGIALEELAEAVFSELELDIFKKSADKVTIFYGFWTRKEALLKAVGVGLVDNLRSIDISRDVDKGFVKAFTQKGLELLSFTMLDENARYFGSLCYIRNNPVRFINLTNEVLSLLSTGT